MVFSLDRYGERADYFLGLSMKRKKQSPGMSFMQYRHNGCVAGLNGVNELSAAPTAQAVGGRTDTWSDFTYRPNERLQAVGSDRAGEKTLAKSAAAHGTSAQGRQALRGSATEMLRLWKTPQ
ncbi:hypothetical protein [Comamonas sp. 23]|uniref:hypothetical protein n=1 Tax=Comamonas sp. 23 TaxID=3415008 RepID=UPI003C6EB915